MTKINTYTKISLIALTILSFTVSNTMATVTPDMVDINLHPGETSSLAKTVELTGLLPIDNDGDGAFDEDPVDLVNNDGDCLDATLDPVDGVVDDDLDGLVDEAPGTQKGGSLPGICIAGDTPLVDEDPGDYTVDYVIDDGCDDASDPFFKTIIPTSYTMVSGGSTVVFSETITVPGTTVPGEYHCDDPQGVEFFADDNTTLIDEDTSLGTEDEWISVIATLGFFKNHPDVTADIIDAADEDGDGTDCGTAVAAADTAEIEESCKTLGKFVVEDGATAVAILEEARAGKDARKMEAAQLLTAKLNVNSGVDVSGPSCTTVAAAISTADTHLSEAPTGLDYDGPGPDPDPVTIPTKSSTPFTKADVTATSGILDSFNNIGC